MIADNIDYYERGFRNVVEWGKANGIPGILMKQAVELPRSEVTVTDGDTDSGGNQSDDDAR